MKFCFYILGKKGFLVLKAFLAEYGISSVVFVASGRDFGVENDYFSEIQNLCQMMKIPFFSRNSTKISNIQIKDTMIYAIGWRWLISDHQNLIVFHDSILPKYRGFSPLVQMLINQEEEIGVTALKATEEYDKGNIIAQEALRISYPLKISQAIDLLIPLYIKLVISITRLLLNNKAIKEIVQDEELASYSLWRNKSDYAINWNWSSQKIINFCNAVGTPFEGAYSFLGKTKVRISEVQRVPDLVIEERAAHVGKIILIKNHFPVIICGSGLIKVIHLEDYYARKKITEVPFRSRFCSHKQANTHEQLKELPSSKK